MKTVGKCIHNIPNTRTHRVHWILFACCRLLYKFKLCFLLWRPSESMHSAVLLFRFVHSSFSICFVFVFSLCCWFVVFLFSSCFFFQHLLFATSGFESEVKKRMATRANATQRKWMRLAPKRKKKKEIILLWLWNDDGFDHIILVPYVFSISKWYEICSIVHITILFFPVSDHQNTFVSHYLYLSIRFLFFFLFFVNSCFTLATIQLINSRERERRGKRAEYVCRNKNLINSDKSIEFTIILCNDSFIL